MLRVGTLTTGALVRSTLDRITRRDPSLGSFVAVDVDGALVAAEQVDAELPGGLDRGLLHGIPIGVKGVIAVEGWPMGCGSFASDAAPARPVEGARGRGLRRLRRRPPGGLAELRPDDRAAAPAAHGVPERRDADRRDRGVRHRAHEAPPAAQSRPPRHLSPLKAPRGRAEAGSSSPGYGHSSKLPAAIAVRSRAHRPMAARRRSRSPVHRRRAGGRLDRHPSACPSGQREPPAGSSRRIVRARSPSSTSP